MFSGIKEFFIKVIKSRLTVFLVVMIVLTAVLVQKLFTLQIVNGAQYLENFTLTVEKTRTTDAVRGNIYDRNGTLLASSELSYTITIEDNGTYDTDSEKNIALNEEFDTIISILEENGDEIVNDFYITLNEDGEYEFTVSGTTLDRFRADVYGRTKISQLKYNSSLGYNEASATAEQIVEYLCSEDNFDIRLEGTESEYADDADTEEETGWLKRLFSGSDEGEEDVSAETEDLSADSEAVSTDEDGVTYYSQERRYEIMVLRYALSQNSYQKYITTDVATDVSEETVAVVKEYADELQGVEIAEDTKRVYYNAEYFSHIIGYTGKMSDEEYEELSAEDDSYETTDIVGKAGIEQAMESYLRGTKGEETVYVNNLGKVLSVKESTDSISGNDVYLSIDADLQIAVYELLEKELAGILYSKIVNLKYSSDTDSSDQDIPIYDVYNALIGNSVIDVDALENAEAGTVQYTIYQKFLSRKETVMPQIESALQDESTAYGDLSDDMQEYIMYIVELLQDSEVFDSSAVDSSDEVYQNWKSEEISVREYFEHAISEDWIDISYFETESKYADSQELYDALVAYILEELEGDTEFYKLIYETLIYDDEISGKQLCLILYEQGVLDSEDDDDYEDLKDGVISSYTFLKNKINNVEITPAQLALNPCTGSVVIMDPDTGELLACVSYPGYDNNLLANDMDTDYYNKIYNDNSLPLYNNATQQTTAPGSTFKMVSAVAALTENLITTSTEINCTGIFDSITPSSKCWIYPSSHGLLNVSEAIRDSCNGFFYEVGYRLSLSGSTYDADQGVEILSYYAEAFGLADKTGLEITESSSKVADEYPVTMAIGQSNNNYTTVQLARYVAAVANEGTVYNLTLLDKVTDSAGNVLEEYSPTVKNTLDEVSGSTWDAIQYGMKLVVETHSQFDDLEIESAGKTGTAQQSDTPNHALFVGYAPYDDPEIAIAVRIANGYSSSNAAELAASIYQYYFELTDQEELLSATADSVGDAAGGTND